LTGYRLTPQIKIYQNLISFIVLENIIKFLGFGNINKSDASGSYFSATIGALNNINAFINMFKAVQLHGAKALDYADFCKIITIMNNKGHLTKTGMADILIIIKGMNNKRTNFTDSSDSTK
jgi:hypothetical protein